MSEKIYHFGTLDIHSAIIVQHALELRKESFTLSDEMTRSNKEIKARIEEIDQLYDDLDRHIAGCVRQDELSRKLKAREVQEASLSVIGR